VLEIRNPETSSVTHRRLVALASVCAALALPATLPAAAAAVEVAPLDITPPSLSVAGVAVDATSPAGATLADYPGVTADDAESGATVACTPAAPATFAIGDTTVTCTATNGAGLTTTQSVTVHVRGAAEQLQDAVTEARGDATTLGMLFQTTARMVAVKHDAAACVSLDMARVLAATLEPLQSLGGIAALADGAGVDIARIQAVLDCARHSTYRLVIARGRVTVSPLASPAAGPAPQVTVPTAKAPGAIISASQVGKAQRKKLSAAQRRALRMLRRTLRKRAAAARKAKRRAARARSYVPAR
jgi:hypothetical protein